MSISRRFIVAFDVRKVGKLYEETQERTTVTARNGTEAIKIARAKLQGKLGPKYKLFEGLAWVQPDKPVIER